LANLTRWNPYDDLQRMRDEFQRVFSAGFPWLGRDESHWGPSVDVRETVTGFVVEAELPGVDRDNLDVTVSEDGITLRGEVREERQEGEGGFRQIERRYGSFHRSIVFPAPVAHEQAAAEYKDGILRITVPKAEPARSKVTKVRISDGGRERRELQ